MQAQIDANDPANGRMCMTAQQAKAYSDPKAVMQEMQKQMPGCTLTAQSVSKMSVQFLGQCKATPDNPYTGTFTGEYV